MAATQRFFKDLNNGYALEVYVWQATQDISGNKSRLDWDLRLTRYGSLRTYSNFQNPWTVVIAGERFSGTSTYNFNNYQILSLHSGSKWINHAADGSLSTTVSASFTDVGSSNYVGDVTEAGFGTHWYTFDTIPRASTPSIASGSHNDADTTITINTNRASTSFTHIVRYTLGSQSGVIAENVGASTTWKIPLDLVNEFPNAPTGYGYIFLDTYNGGTKIGTNGVQFAVRAPASVGPSFTSAAFSEGDATISALALGGGVYVQNKSRLNMTFSGFSGQRGATLAKVQLWVGDTLLGEHSALTGGKTNVGIPTSGSVTLRAVVVDTRGLTASRDYTCTVRAYSKPTIVNFSVVRANSANTIMEDGDYARATVSVAVSSLTTTGGVQRNTIKYQIQSRQRGQTAWTSKENTTAVTGASLTPAPKAYGVYDPGQAHEFLITVTDRLGETNTQIATLPIATIFMHWNKNIGMGLGKFHNPANGMLDVMGGISQNNGQSVLSVQEPIVLISESSTATQSITNGQSWTRSLPSITVTKPTLVRAWIFGTWDTSGNAAFNVFPTRNGADITSITSHTHHSLGSGTIFAYYFEYKVLLQPGTHTLGFRHGVHSGGASLRIRNNNVVLEKIGD